MPVSVNTDDINFNTVEKTGGENVHKLVASEMPKHKHTFTGTEGTTGTQSVNHTHGNTGTVSADHAHRYDHGHGNSIGVVAIGHHYHGNGSMRQQVDPVANPVFGGDDILHEYPMCQGADYLNNGLHSFAEPFSGRMDDAGGHTHSLTGGVSGTGVVSTGGISANHYHGTGANLENHTHNITGSGSLLEIGSDSTHNNIQPYITVYMFKRTA